MSGSSMCRGRNIGWKDLSGENKKMYKNVVAPYLLKLDADYYCEKGLELLIDDIKKS